MSKFKNVIKRLANVFKRQRPVVFANSAGTATEGRGREHTISADKQGKINIREEIKAQAKETLRRKAEREARKQRRALLHLKAISPAQDLIEEYAHNRLKGQAKHHAIVRRGVRRVAGRRSASKDYPNALCYRGKP